MRIERIIEAVPRCRLLAEVGCDHAKLTLLALQKNLCDAAIVSDISPACLRKARRNLCFYDNVTYLVGDGVVTDGREPDCVLICGMGGHTIAKILNGYGGDATFVLSPQSHAELVRAALQEKGYRLEIDTCFAADCKIYELLRAVKGAGRLDALQLKYGAFYREKNPALALRLRRLLQNFAGGGRVNAARIAEITEVLKWQE